MKKAMRHGIHLKEKRKWGEIRGRPSVWPPHLASQQKKGHVSPARPTCRVTRVGTQVVDVECQACSIVGVLTSCVVWKLRGRITRIIDLFVLLAFPMKKRALVLAMTKQANWRATAVQWKVSIFDDLYFQKLYYFGTFRVQVFLIKKFLA